MEGVKAAMGEWKEAREKKRQDAMTKALMGIPLTPEEEKSLKGFAMPQEYTTIGRAKEEQRRQGVTEREAEEKQAEDKSQWEAEMALKRETLAKEQPNIQREKLAIEQENLRLRKQKEQYIVDMNLINNYYQTDDQGNFTTIHEVAKMLEPKVREASFRQYGTFTPREQVKKKKLGIFPSTKEIYGQPESQPEVETPPLKRPSLDEIFGEQGRPSLPPGVLSLLRNKLSLY
jgi:hypothetical protein